MKRALVLLVLLSVLFVLIIPHVLAGGPINIPGYCAAQGKGAPYSQGRDWYCGGSSFNLSMDEVCRWQYGSDSRAVNADYTNANGWSCEGGSSSGNTGGGGTSSGGDSSGSPLNMSGYCSSRGLGAPYTSGRDWFCGGSSFSVSPDEVCRWQGGGSAVSNNVMDPNSWRCGGSGGGYVPPVNSNPVVQPTAVPQSNPVTSGGSSSSLATREWWGSVNPPTSGEYIQVRESGLRVRQFPGTDQVVLGVVRQWDYYPLFEIRGDWGLITGTYGSGWVYLGYVQVFQPSAVTTSSQAASVNTNSVSLNHVARLSECEINRLTAWWYDDPTAVLMFNPNTPSRVLSLLYNLLDITQTTVSAGNRMPDRVVLVFWEDRRDSQLYVDEYWYFSDFMELRHQYTMASYVDNPCPYIIALNAAGRDG